MREAEPVLSAREIRIVADAGSFSETVRKGEIVGLAGLDGHGQVPFLEILAGARRAAAGQVTARHGTKEQRIASLDDAALAKVGYLPADRKRNGIFPGLGVLDNFALGNFERFSRAGWLKVKEARKALTYFTDALSISFASEETPVNRLSGGNQQKVLLARAMARNPSVMLLNDPTRGVDIQTRRALYDFFRKLVAEQDLTLVILSTELEEIIELCDRVLVFRDNTLSVRLERGEMTLDTMMSAMFGQLERSSS